MELCQKDFVFEKLRPILPVNNNLETYFVDNNPFHLGEEKAGAMMVSEWLQDRRKIKPGVYVWTRDINVIFKDYGPEQYDQALREYLIGLDVINILCKCSPCFSQTLGAFTYENGRICVMYRKVHGVSLAVMLQDGLSFRVWLKIFFQILISLEIAQQHFGFSHYDLHADNVVLDRLSEKYSIIIDNLVYEIPSSELVPVLVDFGTSCARIDGRYVGSYNHTNSSIFHFMTPGHDMYRLMVSSYQHAGNSLTRKKILKLFSLIKDIDPYEINVKTKRQGVIRAERDFCKQVVTTQLASYTPMMMITQLYATFHSQLLPIVVSPRTVYHNFNILGGIKDRTIALVAAQALIRQETSYMYPLYFLTLVHKKNMKQIEIMRDQLESQRKLLIEKDMIRLNKVFDIEIPNYEELSNSREAVINLPLRHRNAKQKEENHCKLFKVSSYITTLQPYMDAYYTIIELGIEDYQGWVHRLKTSDIYNFARANRVTTMRARRWSEILISSLARTKTVY